MSLTDIYGPDKVCRRTKCTQDGPADHKGGAHLDPRDRERFDGNEGSLRAVTYKVRDELSALHYATRGKPELEEIVDVALRAALDEIRFLDSQLAHVQVNADHKVREASRQALDCEHHGKTIQQLEEQVTYFDQASERHDRARLALLGGIHAFDEFISAVDTGREMPDTAKLVEAIRGVLKKTHAAHDRAWKR